MNQKYLYTGISFTAAGFILNEIALLLLNLQDPIIPGVQPHSRPPVIGTAFLVLIPVGIFIVIYYFWLQYKMTSGIEAPFQNQT